MFHPNQILSASNIRNAFLSGTRFALLSALCQSGKTGTFQSLIQQMLVAGDVSHAYILCGSSETQLRQQSVDDTKTANSANFGRIKILFHQDFSDATLDVKNALFVLDESHMVQTKGQQLHQFLLKYGITLDGNPEPLEKNNSYFLSVDATPYSELAALYNEETLYPKYVEQLKPGNGYYGLADYARDELLFPTFSIHADSKRFEDLLLSVGQKYVILRLNRSEKNIDNEAELKNLCRKHNFPVCYYTHERRDVAMTKQEQKRAARGGLRIPCLDDQPATTTVVIIRGRLRAGKVVPKKHVSFIWEGASKSKTDALVQGLVGRMCGYAFGKVKPKLFVPVTALVPTEFGRVLKDELPKTSTNMRADQMTNGRSVFST